MGYCVLETIAINTNSSGPKIKTETHKCERFL
jgi:hypothetical protein